MTVVDPERFEELVVEAIDELPQWIHDRLDNVDVLIGENAERTGRCFDGLIDDVRIYNYALSEDQVKTLAGDR